MKTTLRSGLLPRLPDRSAFCAGRSFLLGAYPRHHHQYFFHGRGRQWRRDLLSAFGALEFGWRLMCFAGAKSGGADLRFGRKGSVLAYQIDHWDSAGQSAEIWVSVDSVKGNNSTQTIGMYWGKANAAAASNGSAVFDTAKGFLGVWHMGGAAGDRPNATPGGAVASPKSATTGSTYLGLSVAGVVGTCDRLRVGSADNATTTPTGTRDYFDESPLPSFSGFTFSAWVYASTASTWMRFFDFGSGRAVDNIFQRMASASDLMFDVFPSQDAIATGAFVTGQWKYYTATLTPQDAADRLRRRCFSTALRSPPAAARLARPCALRGFSGAFQLEHRHLFHGKV